MKNMILKLFLAVLCVYSVSCSGKSAEGTFNIVLGDAGDAAMLFEAKSSSRSFAFKSPSDWRVEFDDGVDWCTIDPDSGQAGGNVVTVTVDENRELVDRTVTFSIVSDGQDSDRIRRFLSGLDNDKFLFKIHSLIVKYDLCRSGFSQWVLRNCKSITIGH